MRFSQIATVYFLMGVIVVAAGVVPLSQLGLASVFIDVNDDGSVETNSSAVGGNEDSEGMLDGLIGPVKNAMNTITGGALLAVWGPISTLTGFYAWPVVTMRMINAPTAAVMLSGAMVASFSFGVLRVFRASI